MGLLVLQLPDRSRRHLRPSAVPDSKTSKSGVRRSGRAKDVDAGVSSGASRRTETPSELPLPLPLQVPPEMSGINNVINNNAQNIQTCSLENGQKANYLCRAKKMPSDFRRVNFGRRGSIPATQQPARCAQALSPAPHQIRRRKCGNRATGQRQRREQPQPRQVPAAPPQNRCPFQ